MNSERNKFILFGLNNIYIIVLILQIFFKYISIKCDICDTFQIRTWLYGNKPCPAKCNGGVNKHFYIYEQGYQCIMIDNCPQETVYSTKECVEKCNGNKLGGFCYFDDEFIPSDLYKTEGVVKKCQYFKYIMGKVEGKEVIKCYYNPNSTVHTNVEPCPNQIYDFKIKECLNSCGKYKKTYDLQFIYTECKDECDIGDYKDETEKTCTTSCYENNHNDIYYYPGNEINLCINKCNRNHFYEDYSDHTYGFKCNSKCNYPYHYHVVKNNDFTFFRCYNPSDYAGYSSNGCPNNTYYKYRNACVKNCKDTISITHLGGTTTYSILINGQQRCVENCYLYDKYGDKTDYTCKSPCPKYSQNYLCVDACYNDYVYIEDTYECISQCPNDYYKTSDGKRCVKICPSTEQYIQNKICTNCNGGYLLNGYTNIDGPKTCYSNCPSYTYSKYNDNNKICYYFPPDEGCYFEEDNFKICYTSCTDLSRAKNIDYKYIDENICYKDFNCGDRYYYKDSSGNTYCISNESDEPSQRPNYIKVCTKMEYYYLRGKECISGCNLENEYVIFPTNNSIYLGMTILGACCLNPDCNDTYQYYSEDHILRETCEYKKINSGKVHTRNGNCVKSCPPEYPFENEDGNDCSEKCDNKIYYIGNTKKCVSFCNTYNKFFFEGEKDCLDSCKKTLSSGVVKYYYYEETNNQCYTSCKLINKFSFKNDEGKYHQKCLSSCPDQYKYYYKDDYFCLSSCGNGFIQDERSNKYVCVHQCQEDELIVYNKYCRKKSEGCPNEEPFITFTTVNGVMSEKCVSNCVTTTHKYIFGNRCYIECPSNAPFHYSNSIMCISKNKCGPGHYISSKICYTQCPNERPYFVSETNNNFKCVPFCDLNKYYISTTNECVLECNIGENFIGKNKKCKNQCNENEDGKYYIKYKEKTNYNIYLCIKDYKNYGDSINHVLYLVEGTNEIVADTCPSNKPYASYNGFICLTNCLTDSLLKFSTEQEGKKICSSECINPKYKYYYEEDKICLQNCSIYRNDIINDEDNRCVFECNITSKYKFKEKKKRWLLSLFYRM